MENSSVRPYSETDLNRWQSQWLDIAREQTGQMLKDWMLTAPQDKTAGPLMAAIFGNSPYLSRLLLSYPQVLYDFITLGADKCHAVVITELAAIDPAVEDYSALMQNLRQMKGKLALMVALADLSETWALSQITQALSAFAEQCLQNAIDTILTRGARLGEIELSNPVAPSEDSGVIMLGMGKLGGQELNYSSDIDIIIFYEPGKLRYKGRHNEQYFMNRLAHDLVQIMQERTPSGYVFRTDLRLRPDPASTPPAITINAAYYYYESVGQNWERAAMIKARPVAGDIVAGNQFLKGIAPFMWRRSLDFASINDIHSIKRQMDSKQSKNITPAGHNIKLGMGGIREIEFYAQIHQLIWGGRQLSLRTKATCETLNALEKFGLIDGDCNSMLRDSYAYLRKLEHRLQMINDEQTHSLPDTAEGIEHVACFMGYPDTQSFEKDLIETLTKVHAVYASSFKNTSDTQAAHLGGIGNLVFTGTVHDPDTLATLRSMGFAAPEIVSEMVMGWHHGSKRATRTKRARELLTELMPQLLTSIANTANPDTAFLKFNEFLTNLPAGVQLFSLFHINPHLLQLIADIMGSAPTLADTLSKTPSLLESVLYEDFYESLPSKENLSQQLDELLASLKEEDANYFEEYLNRLRQFRNEKSFQAGVQFLKHMITCQNVGIYLADLADVIIQKTLASVMAEFAKTYGTIPDSQFAIIGMGKLGSHEMTFTSDIDLVFVYSVADFDAVSDGEKSFGASVYFNRLAQRFLGALTSMGTGGRLYEVDTRLRPSGAQGLLAVSTQALTHYFEEMAWTFEYMAFTKARVVSGSPAIKETLDHFICSLLSKPRDLEKLRADASDMRKRIAKEHPGVNAWDIKYVQGGLMDIDFIAQYLLLHHATITQGANTGSASQSLKWLEKMGCIPASFSHELIDADSFMSEIFHMLRLCSAREFNEDSAPEGLKKLLFESVKEPDFSTLTARLIQVEQTVHGHYIAVLGSTPL